MEEAFTAGRVVSWAQAADFIESHEPHDHAIEGEEALDVEINDEDSVADEDDIAGECDQDGGECDQDGIQCMRGYSLLGPGPPAYVRTYVRADSYPYVLHESTCIRTCATACSR